VKKWHIAVIVVVVVAVAAGSFFGGRAAAGGGTPTVEEAMKALQNATPQQLQQAAANGNGLPGAFQGTGGAGPNGTGTGRFTGGNAVAGQIIAADDSSITVKTSDGSTKIVLLSSSTSITKTQQGSKTDLTTGQEVVVTGTTNSDGTVAASRVQVGANLAAVQGTRTQGGSTSGSPSTAAPAQ
jgi:hypothetical protein